MNLLQHTPARGVSIKKLTDLKKFLQGFLVAVGQISGAILAHPIGRIAILNFCCILKTPRFPGGALHDWEVMYHGRL
jgi:hypothetical protein